MCTEATSFCSGGLVSHQSPAFQEEFPSLAPEEKGKETKKEEENKDTQYGPGPSLRPQSKLALLFYHEQIVYSLGFNMRGPRQLHQSIVGMASALTYLYVEACLAFTPVGSVMLIFVQKRLCCNV